MPLLPPIVFQNPSSFLPPCAQILHILSDLMPMSPLHKAMPHPSPAQSYSSSSELCSFFMTNLSLPLSRYLCSCLIFFLLDHKFLEGRAQVKFICPLSDSLHIAGHCLLGKWVNTALIKSHWDELSWSSVCQSEFQGPFTWGGDRSLLKNADSWTPLRPTESESVGGGAWESEF